jgi:hypothetical protein
VSPIDLLPPKRRSTPYRERANVPHEPPMLRASDLATIASALADAGGVGPAADRVAVGLAQEMYELGYLDEAQGRFEVRDFWPRLWFWIRRG